jgi:hypothetical protein
MLFISTLVAMKKFTITIAIITLAVIACKKKSEYCYYEAMKGNSPIYIWEYNKPSSDQVQKVQDTCSCAVTIKETCLPCKTRTDAGGNDIGCD